MVYLMMSGDRLTQTRPTRSRYSRRTHMNPQSDITPSDPTPRTQEHGVSYRRPVNQKIQHNNHQRRNVKTTARRKDHISQLFIHVAFVGLVILRRRRVLPAQRRRYADRQRQGPYHRDEHSRPSLGQDAGVGQGSRHSDVAVHGYAAKR